MGNLGHGVRLEMGNLGHALRPEAFRLGHRARRPHCRRRPVGPLPGELCGAAGERVAERGSAAVEFALVLPLLLLVGLALVQVGLLAKDQLVVLEAARAGAREAAVTTDDDAARQAAVAAAATLDPERLEVSVGREDGAGSAVTVAVTYRAPIVVDVVQWLFPAEVDLSGSAVMRQETG